MVKNIYYIALILLNFSLLLSQNINWTNKASMPDARRNHSVVSLNGKVYVVGGYGQPNKGRLATVFEYDVDLDIWTQKADMPTSRSNLGVAVVDGKIYAIGGYAAANSTGMKNLQPPKRVALVVLFLLF